MKVLNSDRRLLLNEPDNEQMDELDDKNIENRPEIEESIDKNVKDINSKPFIPTNPINKENIDKSNGFVRNSAVVIPILLKDRRTAHLGLPEDAKSEDLDTIINWIRLMKESF